MSKRKPKVSNKIIKQRKKENDDTKDILIEGVKVKFPFQPYSSQITLMEKIIKSLNESSNALLESPTGTGKTLALLCATLAFQKDQNLKHLQRMKMAKKKEVESAFETSMTWITNELHGQIQFESKAQITSISNDKVSTEHSLSNLASHLSSLDVSDNDLIFKENQFINPSGMIAPVQLAKNTFKDKVINENLFNQINNEEEEEDLKPFKIYYGTRTHKQVAQVVMELRQNTSYQPKMSILGSRDHYCIHPDVINKPDKEELCRLKKEEIRKYPKDKINSIVTSRRLNERFLSGAKYSKQKQMQIDEYLGSEESEEEEEEGKTTENKKKESKSAYSSKKKVNFEKVCIHSHDSAHLARIIDNSEFIPSIRKSRTLKTKKDLGVEQTSIWDIEDLVLGGKQEVSCPFYASREIAKNAEIIFCPYNYILYPSIRKAMEIDLTGNVVLLDEAHNIEDVARSAATFDVNDMTISFAKEELQHLQGHAPQESTNLINLLNAAYKFTLNHPSPKEESIEYGLKQYVWDSKAFWDYVKEDTGFSPAFLYELRRNFDKIAEIGNKQNTENDFYPELSSGTSRFMDDFLNGLNRLHYNGDAYKVFVSVIDDKNQKSQDKKLYKLEFVCFDSGILFSEISKEARSVILTSGTLSPLNTFSSELKTKFEYTFEASHVIRNDQLWAGVIPIGPNKVALNGVYNTVQTLAYQDDIGNALKRICDIAPGGILCFIPSYTLLDKLIARWRMTKLYTGLNKKKKIFVEPRKGDAEEFEKMLEEYKAKANKVSKSDQNRGCTGALMLAVFRGKLSEGIDFKDASCRVVVSVGLPFPSFKDFKVVFKKSYNNTNKRTRGLQSGDQWYNIQAYRAINQALGRCIRHKDDWGAMVLLDKRLGYSQHSKSISKWIQSYLRIYRDFDTPIKELERFMNRLEKSSTLKLKSPYFISNDPIDSDLSEENDLVHGSEVINEEYTESGDEIKSEYENDRVNDTYQKNQNIIQNSGFKINNTSNISNNPTIKSENNTSTNNFEFAVKNEPVQYHLPTEVINNNLIKGEPLENIEMPESGLNSYLSTPNINSNCNSINGNNEQMQQNITIKPQSENLNKLPRIPSTKTGSSLEYSLIKQEPNLNIVNNANNLNQLSGAAINNESLNENPKMISLYCKKCQSLLFKGYKINTMTLDSTLNFPENGFKTFQAFIIEVVTEKLYIEPLEYEFNINRPCNNSIFCNRDHVTYQYFTCTNCQDMLEEELSPIMVRPVAINPILTPKTPNIFNVANLDSSWLNWIWCNLNFVYEK